MKLCAWHDTDIWYRQVIIQLEQLSLPTTLCTTKTVGGYTSEIMLTDKTVTRHYEKLGDNKIVFWFQATQQYILLYMLFTLMTTCLGHSTSFRSQAAMQDALTHIPNLSSTP